MESMKKTKYGFLILALFLYSCAGGSVQQSVDAISNGVSILNTAYFEAERGLIALHQVGTLSGASWNTIVDYNTKKVDPAMHLLWDAWEKVPDAAGPVQTFLISSTFLNALALVLDIAKLAGKTDTVMRLETLQGQVLELKK